jgi:mannan endo-1,6-alpha-mannosidase
MSNYTSNHTGEIPGIVNDSWWESAVLYRTLIQYWSLTGDASNNPAVTQGMYWQRGDNDYMPSNISEYIGNDDQASWALAAMTAAESKFPEETKLASWITLAQNVFDIQAARWDTKNCGGGLRWQIWTFQAGYGIKNAISNGDLFELSARLARYTGNKTYVEWAEKVWDWTLSTQLMNNKTWTIADSMSVEDRCATLEHTQWSHNYAVYLSGAAYMYNLVCGRLE